uniref:ankyrin repeat family A protein 2-like isoform X2 n=1 Tax=Myxine glutinosa TaxID=7769 RepID=UPI00358F9139
MEDKSTSTVLNVCRNAGVMTAAQQSENHGVGPVAVMEETGDVLRLDGRPSPGDDDDDRGPGADEGPGISRIDLKDCLRFVNSLNEQNSLNIQDQVNSDLEVASVLLKAESGTATSPSAGGIRQPIYTPSAGKHFSPVKQATTLTNKQRGNEVSTPSYSFINSLTVHQLAAKGEIEHLANRLEHADCKVNQTDEHGFTPLIWAAAHGQITVVDFLLQKGANVMALGQERESALALAAARGDVAIVNLLLQSKADINIYDWNSGTPLLYAVRGNHAGCVQMLLGWLVHLVRKGVSPKRAVQTWLCLAGRKAAVLLVHWAARAGTKASRSVSNGRRAACLSATSVKPSSLFVKGPSARVEGQR